MKGPFFCAGEIVEVNRPESLRPDLQRKIQGRTAFVERLFQRLGEDVEWIVVQFMPATARQKAFSEQFMADRLLPAPSDAASRFRAWSASEDACSSGLAIGNWLLHNQKPSIDCRAPYDSLEFARCLRLLRLISEFRKDLDRMADVSPQWAALVAQWGNLEMSYLREAGELGRMRILQRDHAETTTERILETLERAHPGQSQGDQESDSAQVERPSS